MTSPSGPSPNATTTWCVGPSSAAAGTSPPWKHPTCWSAMCGTSSASSGDAPAGPQTRRFICTEGGTRPGSSRRHPNSATDAPGCADAHPGAAAGHSPSVFRVSLMLVEVKIISLRSVQARQQAWHHSVVEDGGRWDGQRLAAHRQGLPARWRQRHDATGGEVQVATLAALAGEQQLIDARKPLALGDLVDLRVHSLQEFLPGQKRLHVQGPQEVP